ncbi:6-bladed beta-propeller [uncultured Bacteroides sp.]|uniref:6-bladed beta-propeller n=1 Tax=uncultured Bacteroides sp. TaxID=162156 RepID=UPI0025D1DC95|nr:6-bladed beta-propeller [uncultured Bacteroides sp.]
MKPTHFIHSIQWISLLLLLCTACQPHRPNEPSAFVSEHIDNLPDTCLFSHPQVFIPELTEKSLIASIDRIIRHNGRYYILDKRSKQVLCYEASGKFIHSIRSVGNGPGEYTALTDMTIDPESSQLILLGYPSTLLYYNLEGAFVKSICLENPTSFHALSADNEFIYLLNPTFYNDKPTETSITIIDKKHPEKSYRILEPLPETAPYCHASGRNLTEGTTTLFTRRFDSHIYRLKGKELSPEIHINWGELAFPEAQKEQIFACAELAKLCMEHNYIYSISNMTENDHRILFTTNLPGSFVLDKHTREIIHYRKIINSYLGLPMPNQTCITDTGNPSTCFVYPAHVLCRMKENEALGKMLSKRGLALLEEIMEESNPVIFCYTLR